MDTATAIRQTTAQLEAELAAIGDVVLDEEGRARYTLADAIREGGSVAEQARNWSGPEGQVCALSAAAAACRARGV